MIVFSLSTILMFMSDSVELKRINKWIRPIFIILSIFLVSIFAGLRNESIGTDILVYGNNVFYDSIKYNDFFTYYNSTEGWFKVEPIYMLLNFISSSIIESPVFFYFLLSLVINSCIFVSIFNFREKINITYAWMSYLLIYYGYTFNLLRQSLALGFYLLAFTFLYKRKYTKGVIFLLLSWGSHFSSFPISIFIVCLFFVLRIIENKPKALIFFIALSFVMLLSINPIVNILIESNLLPEKYLMYLTNMLGVGISIKSFLLKFPILLVYLYSYNFMKEEEKENYYLFLSIFILDFIFYQLRIVNVTFSRISLYMNIFQIISIPYVVNFINTENYLSYTIPKIKKDIIIKIDKLFIMRIYFIYLIIVWYYQVVIVGINEIYPYYSDILGIF